MLEADLTMGAKEIDVRIVNGRLFEAIPRSKTGQTYSLSDINENYECAERFVRGKRLLLSFRDKRNGHTLFIDRFLKN